MMWSKHTWMCCVGRVVVVVCMFVHLHVSRECDYSVCVCAWMQMARGGWGWGVVVGFSHVTVMVADPTTLEPKGRSQQFLPVRARLHPMLEVKIENSFWSYSATNQIDIIIIIIDSALRGENEADLLVNEAAAVRAETEAPGTPYTEGVMQRRDTQTAVGTKLGKRTRVHRIAREAGSDLQGKKNNKKKNRNRMHLPSPAARCCAASLCCRPRQ